MAPGHPVPELSFLFVFRGGFPLNPQKGTLFAERSTATKILVGGALLWCILPRDVRTLTFCRKKKRLPNKG